MSAATKRKAKESLSIARENDFLTIESPADWGLPKLRIRPESQRDFFATELPLRVTFQTGPTAKSAA